MSGGKAGEEPPRLTLFVTPYCGFCRMARRLLETRGIPFEILDAADPDVRDMIVRRTGWRTVPVILLDGELIGGYQELAALDRSGELARRLG